MKEVKLIVHSKSVQAFIWPALVAQLNTHPPGDQEVSGLIPAASATFFHGD